MALVVDASVVFEALISTSSDGRWAEQIVESDELLGPHLLPAECASAIRLAEIRGDLTSEAAALAYSDLQELKVALVPFHPFAQRIWQLRQSVTPYDAWYVAIAEAYDVSLATLDRRLAQANGVRCHFLIP